MDKGIYTALSGSIVQERRMDIISNNLANVNSAGYKGDIPVFESYLNQQKGVNIPATVIPGVTPNEYVVNSNHYIDFSQGPLHGTANELDLALNGDGFFAVDTPDGIRYTRNGNFKIDAEGLLTTQDGYPVLGGEGGGGEHIYINVLSLTQQGEVSVSADGTISVIDRFSGDVPVRMTGGYKLKIVDFEKPYALRKAGNGLYAPMNKGIAELEAKNTEVKQGFIERSNINTIKEMTSMIEVVRGYESYQKAIQSFSDSTSKLVDEVGKAM
ncbi:MAG: flagellar basal-body rod protein FlgF [Nitrospinae bacterium]|nr:flagellar basal-body rod protein FlgF [Nitrospinota bacterium]